MHEASLMHDLMEKILDVAKDKGDRVTAVSIWLGALSHMSPAHFREHYAAAAKGTIAEGAALNIELSEDINHEYAQSILLKNVEVMS